MSGFNAEHLAAVDAAARARQRAEFRGLSAFERHKRLIHDLTTYYGGTLPSSQQQQQVPIKSDEAALREAHRFIRTAEDDASDAWEVRLAKKYYSRLFKEYAIADFSRYGPNAGGGGGGGGQLGLRWRTQAEVVSGRGQFSCGARGCSERDGLGSFEVPFGYQEAGQRRAALVKLRLCPAHAALLGEGRKKAVKKKRKRRDDSSSSESSSDSDSSESEDERRRRRRKKEKKRKRKERRRGGSKDADKNDGFEEFMEGLLK